jgi:hypothetical protein
MSSQDLKHHPDSPTTSKIVRWRHRWKQEGQLVLATSSD